MNSAQQPPPPFQPRYIAPGVLICVLGMLFSAASGTYVGMNSPGQITILVMQAFVVYSFPYLLLAVVGIIACHINRLRVMSVIFALCAALLLSGAIAATMLSLSGQGTMVHQLGSANIKAFIVGVVVAVLSAVLMLIAAKSIRPRPARPDDFLPF